MNASGGRRFRSLLVVIPLGILLALARAVFSFLPGVSLADVILFGGVGFAVADVTPRRRVAQFFAIVAPTMLLLSSFVVTIGLDWLAKGHGSIHLLGLLLVPLSAGIGLTLGGRRRIASTT